jgi:hypothetical protein
MPVLTGDAVRFDVVPGLWEVEGIDCNHDNSEESEVHLRRGGEVMTRRYWWVVMHRIDTGGW